MQKNNENAVALLDRYCESALNSKDDKSFFLYVADYVKFVANNTETNNAISKILEERNEEYKIQTDFENAAIKEIAEILEKLKSLALKNKTIKKRVSEIFSENEKYERGDINSTETKADRLFGYAREIIRLQKDNGEKKSIAQYIETDPENPDIILFYHISDAYDQYTKEKDLIRYRTNFILGNEWNNLVWAYSAINNVRDLLKTIDEIEKKEVFLWFTYFDRYKEMRGIMEGKKEGLGIFFKREEYQKSLIRINNYLSQELLLRTQKKSPQKNQIDTMIPAEGEPIKNVKIFKGERKFYILINDKKPFELPIRSADEKSKKRYWDLVISIAENGTAELDLSTSTGVLSYLNTNKTNPILKVFGIQKWLEINGEFLYARTGVKIEVMKDFIRKKYF